MALCAVSSAGWILDLLFFLILILGTAFGAYRGFVSGVCRLAGKFASIAIAFLFCVSFSNLLELLFSLTTGLTNGIAGAIAKNGAYALPLPSDVSGAEISGALSGMGIGWLPRLFIQISFRSVELIPAGTTPAILISSVLAKWISIIISFLLLIILVRLGAKLLTKSFDALKDHFGPLRAADQALGAALGFFKAFFLFFLFLIVLNWLPIASLHTALSSGGLVGKIFSSEWFQNATSYAISGKWFHKLMQ